jgi:hypothetical protein
MMHRRLQVVWWLQWIFRSFFCPNMLANIVAALRAWTTATAREEAGSQ